MDRTQPDETNKAGVTSGLPETTPTKQGDSTKMTTETQTTEEEQLQFRISIDHYLDMDSWTCPICGGRMCEDGFEYVCRAVTCPHLLQPTIREVVGALIDQGRDPLQAAQLAASYSVELDDEEMPVTPERFVVTDEAGADWVLRKMAEIETRLSAANKLCDDEIERINVRRERMTSGLASQLNFFRAAFGPQLADWTARRIQGQKTRSVTLLHGVTGYRRNPEHVEIDLPESAIACLEEVCPAAVRIRKEVLKTELKSYLTDQEATELQANGVVVAHIEPGEDVFYVKPESLEAKAVGR